VGFVADVVFNDPQQLIVKALFAILAKEDSDGVSRTVYLLGKAVLCCFFFCHRQAPFNGWKYKTAHARQSMDGNLGYWVLGF